MNRDRDIEAIQEVLNRLREEGKIRIAVLYGSFARGSAHPRSDIDLALYVAARDETEEIEVAEQVLMSADREVSILRLDDEEESPFVVQEALHGEHLVEPDKDTLNAVTHRVLHECEGIRFRRGLRVEAR